MFSSVFPLREVICDYLIAKPLLVLLGVIVLGLVVAKVSIRGVSLGVASIMLVGLSAGAFLGEKVSPPDMISSLGLGVFVYLVGITAGPSLFRFLREHGTRFVLAILFACFVASCVLFVLSSNFGFSIPFPLAGGLFAGALTNTPALLAFSESLARNGVSGSMLSMPLIGYAIGYPIALVLAVLSTEWALRKYPRVEAIGPNERDNASVVNSESLSRILIGDGYVVRKMIVSSKEVVGKSLGVMSLEERFGAFIIDVRRADVELAYNKNLVLEIGDHVRVASPVKQLANIARFFGDSFSKLREWDYLPTAIGMFAGVALGQLSLRFGPFYFQIGVAAGPLFVGIFLGWLRRTGPFVWHLPPASAATLRYWGLALFLSASGIRAGAHLTESLSSQNSVFLVLTSVCTSVSFIGTFFFFGIKVFHVKIEELMGAFSGAQTTSVVQEKAYEITRSQESVIAYAANYPVAMIIKVILVQIFTFIWVMMYK